ncbi:hypothetical protein MEBOL_003578 [Melittangium boletus DSM 14713]|uniref:Uncharacterized protein n=1 Tax=Melittangium boletus DSM 14713 TaxID=1294270 RepID=A0A250IFW4_9BACT|nr:hypothetical protein MEBOL_003578 [Melittangium boletus DSM 14713]
MRELESRHDSGARPRPVLWVLPAVAPRPPMPPGEHVWVEAEGLRLTSERLEVAGGSWGLAELRGYGTRRESPGLVLPLGMGAGAALVVPMLLLQPDSFRVTAALVVATLLVFTAIARLVAAADTYWLVVRTAEGERPVWHCQDHQLFARVEQALGEVLEPPAPAPREPPVRRLALVR